ncbi:MAG: ferritin-like domain-containing protein [Chloroflexota bacterium]|nr:ferritin-like domain-containing protein [Chloroflexota bacterium]
MHSNRYVESLLAAMRDERHRLQSRRGLITTSAKAIGAGALLSAVPMVRARGVAAQDFADDVDVLNYALTLEHLEYAFYRDGLQVYNLRAFDEADRPSSVYPRFQEIRGHELTHINALTGLITDLDGEPVEEAEYDFGYEDFDGFLATAQALENTGVAAYAGAAPSISDPAILAAALGIHSVEARHAAYLNERVSASPFPDAIDLALTPDEVLAIAGPFIVSGGDDGTPEAEGSPEAEGTPEG